MQGLLPAGVAETPAVYFRCSDCSCKMLSLISHSDAMAPSHHQAVLVQRSCQNRAAAKKQESQDAMTHDRGWEMGHNEHMALFSGKEHHVSMSGPSGPRHTKPTLS